MAQRPGISQDWLRICPDIRRSKSNKPAGMVVTALAGARIHRHSADRIARLCFLGWIDEHPRAPHRRYARLYNMGSPWLSVMSVPPILSRKRYSAPSIFTPESLLREARRQKQLGASAVPEICVLDPDGDVVRHLCRFGRASHARAGPAITPICRHSAAKSRNMASSAVRSGRRLPSSSPRSCSHRDAGCSISVTSAGQILPANAAIFCGY